MQGSEGTGGRGQVTASPIHRAMSEADGPIDLFESAEPVVSGLQRLAMEQCLNVARTHAVSGTVYDDAGLVATEVVADLADVGYWGLRADVEYGGSGCPFAAWAPFVADMTTVDPWIAALSSTHAALGPVNLIGAFGNREQKARLLPPLTAGQRLGAFAVTEPGTASDWGAIRTIAVRSGDRLLLSGEKLFISNAAPGRTAAVLAMVDGRLRMLIAELPFTEDDRFRIVGYDLLAPRHITNRALIFRDLPVPTGNMLDADGRAVAYHGLNHGRVLACGLSAGLLRMMAGALIPWVQTRKTFGAPIGRRELVRRRLGRLAARITACDALLSWTSQLLDQGYRGELECVAAKVFATEAVKEATVDLLLKTHGSRAFLPGSLLADALYDMLSLAVFEGENEILTLGSFSTLAKARTALPRSEPPAAPAGRRPAGSFDLEDLALTGATALLDSGHELDAALLHYGATMADRQAVAVELAQRIQQAVVMLVVARYGTRQDDPLLRQAAVCMASELSQRLSGTRPTAAYYRLLTELGAAVGEDQFAPVAATRRGPVAMPDHVLRPSAGTSEERPTTRVPPHAEHPNRQRTPPRTTSA
jgi:alkylation response protein AidB-like acyl-CoA dehydrogenase